jgi:exopolysaccharide production protein ExoQ
MNSSFAKWVDFLILACAFFLIAHNLDSPLGGTDPSLSPYGATAGTGTLGKQIGSFLLFCYGLFALLVNRRRTFSFRTLSAKLAIAFIVLITLSLGWSVERSSSAIRLVGFFTYVLAAAGAVKRLGGKDILRWYVFAQFSYLILGLLNELRLHTFSPFVAWYRFSGIADDNATGNDAAVLVFASISMLRLFPSSWLYRTTLFTSIVILLLTKSRTALFSTIFALMFAFCLVSFRGMKLGLSLYGMAMLVWAFFVLSSLNLIQISGAVSLGREQSNNEALNGRVPLWTELYDDFADKRPILGYGYGAFWTPNRIEDISADQGWSIAAAHSIYLDAILAIGFCGAILYLCTLLSLLGKSVQVARGGKQEGFFFACLLCALLFDGFSDSEPWFISSIYLFASIQAVFVLNSLETNLVAASGDSSGKFEISQEDHLIARS